MGIFHLIRGGQQMKIVMILVTAGYVPMERSYNYHNYGNQTLSRLRTFSCPKKSGWLKDQWTWLGPDWFWKGDSSQWYEGNCQVARSLSIVKICASGTGLSKNTKEKKDNCTWGKWWSTWSSIPNSWTMAKVWEHKVSSAQPLDGVVHSAWSQRRKVGIGHYIYSKRPVSKALKPPWAWTKSTTTVGMCIFFNERLWLRLCDVRKLYFQHLSTSFTWCIPSVLHNS